ncbi:6905_t:CDS:2 [Ambispora leptoticha]|uniref:6905_t:CDS:1 n=1 Tax=Ambispora leptoticha TaxID=144679 RepID=A0A9N9ALY4_9GLOM|nr:6905_t:CDS:2 [Ambispora leptoticha]
MGERSIINKRVGCDFTFRILILSSTSLRNFRELYASRRIRERIMTDNISLNFRIHVKKRLASLTNGIPSTQINLQTMDEMRMKAMTKISKYLNENINEDEIHVLYSDPRYYEVIHQQRKTFSWPVDISTVTLDTMKLSILKVLPFPQDTKPDDLTLRFAKADEKNCEELGLEDDATFRQYLKSCAVQAFFTLKVQIDTVQKPFSDWKLDKNERGIDTLRSNRKNSIPRQVSTDTNYYGLRCLVSPLELRASALKEDDSRGANQISIRESRTLSTEYNDSTARSNIASGNSQPHILKSSIETERQRCEIHDGFVDSLPSNSENGGSKYKDGENTDIKLGKEREGCPNTGIIGRMQASFGKLLRIGSLGGDGWKKIVPGKTCRLVHADYRFTSKGKSITENPTTMSQVQLCEGKNGRTSRCNDSLILVDAFKDNSRIVTLVNYEVLDNKVWNDLLDCYGRVFLWENESQTLWPLGDSPEKASKRIVKGVDQLCWFEDNGTVYEQITKWEDYY